MATLTLLAPLFAFVCRVSAFGVPPDPGPCDPSLAVCEYTFTVEEQLSMTWNHGLVTPRNGTLQVPNFKDLSQMLTAPPDEVITLDGFRRVVTAVNGKFPGTPIIVTEGQKVRVKVINKLYKDDLTIHWHGLGMRNTPWMDGVPYVTQCPVPASQSFTYTFEADVPGTYFYHSHMAGQRADGLAGALIIREKTPKYPKAEDVIMNVGDWFHDATPEIDVKIKHRWYEMQPGYKNGETADGIVIAPIKLNSILVEGKGKYKNEKTGEWSEVPYKEFFVKKGTQYRFRVINSGNGFPLRVSVDEHTMTLMASDAFYFKERVFESFVIQPGERYDFLLDANKDGGDYWIRVDGMEVNFPDHYGRAILRYSKSSTSDPKTQRKACTKEAPCEVLNCQFRYYPASENTKCVFVDELVREGGEPTPKVTADDPEDIFMNWIMVAPGYQSVNGRLFVNPSVPALTQGDEIDPQLLCENRPECEKGVCFCTNIMNIPKDKTIQMVWTNYGTFNPKEQAPHVIHLHGHSFHVIKVGVGKYDPTSAKKLSNTEDIKCIDDNCHRMEWADKSSNGDGASGGSPDNAIQKDSIIVPEGGYAVIRFKADNPGKWIIHCHIDIHVALGMAMVINEDPDAKFSIPPGFPRCGDYHDDPKLDKNYVLEGQCAAKDGPPAKENASVAPPAPGATAGLPLANAANPAPAQVAPAPPAAPVVVAGAPAPLKGGASAGGAKADAKPDAKTEVKGDVKTDVNTKRDSTCTAGSCHKGHCWTKCGNAGWCYTNGGGEGGVKRSTRPARCKGHQDCCQEWQCSKRAKCNPGRPYNSFDL